MTYDCHLPIIIINIIIIISIISFFKKTQPGKFNYNSYELVQVFIGYITLTSIV